VEKFYLSKLSHIVPGLQVQDDEHRGLKGKTSVARGKAESGVTQIGFEVTGEGFTDIA
jgi:hypothetical protein